MHHIFSKMFVVSRYILLSLILVLLLSACTDKVDLDPRERAVLVHCILEDSTVQTVQLNYSSYVSENYCPPVEQAEVYIEKLSKGAVVERYDFYKVKDGVWQGEFEPCQLVEYRLSVRVPNYELITAITEFPMIMNYVKPSSSKKIMYKSEAVGEMKSSKYNHQRVYLVSLMDYVPEDGSYTPAKGVHMWFDGIINDEEVEQSLRKDFWMFEDMYYEGRYQIIRDIVSVSSSDSIRFSKGYKTEERRFCYSIYANFDYGAFSTINFYGIRPYYVGDRGESGSYYSIHPLSYLLVQCINRDYELYIKDVIAKSLSLNLSDLTQIWEKDEIYSNIKNGIGIFAAESRGELMAKDYWYHVYGDYYAPAWMKEDIIIPGWNDK